MMMLREAVRPVPRWWCWSAAGRRAAPECPEPAAPCPVLTTTLVPRSVRRRAGVVQSLPPSGAQQSGPAPMTSSMPEARNDLRCPATMVPTTSSLRARNRSMSMAGEPGDVRCRTRRRGGWLQQPGTVHKGLGGDAGHVDAGAADHATLHHGNALPGRRQVHGERLAGLAATHHQKVKFLRWPWEVLSPSGGAQDAAGPVPQRARCGGSWPACPPPG